jgi:cell division protein FtsB
MLSRVRRQPLHAAKRAPRRRPQLHVHLHVPRPHVHVPRPRLHIPRPHLKLPRPHLRIPSSPVPALVAFVARWRGGRAALSLEHRRARSILLGAIALAVVVLLTSFPIEGLLSQRSSLSGTAHELTTVQAENNALARQVSDLSNPSTVNDLARQDYGFVPKGQRVYDVLPSSSPSGSDLSETGLVPLNGAPVAPGSARSQALIGIVAPVGVTGATHVSDKTAASGSRSVASAVDVEPPEPHSYWGRVVRSLEFWN